MSSKFEYDYDVTREINFRRWYEADTIEKEEFGEKPYLRSEARDVFDKLYDLFEKVYEIK